MIQFAWPWMLLILPLPWLLARLLPPARPQGGALFLPFAAGLAGDSVPASRALPRARKLLFALVWLSLLAAAARPQWLGEPQAVPSSGRRLLLAVDVSGSMASEDMAGGYSRLQVVQKVAGDFIQGRRGDRVGLILFGTRPYLQAPLTADLGTVGEFLRQAVVGVAGTQTAIGDAIGLAIKRLSDEGDKHGNQAGGQGGGETVLILLTDGSNTAGAMPPEQAAKLAAAAGLRIYTIGVGSSGEAGWFGFAGGGGDLDEDTLKGIARATGGAYFRATDASALEQVYARIDRMEPSAGREQWYRPSEEWFFWPLGLALLLSLPAVLWRGTGMAMIQHLHFLRPAWLLALPPLWGLAWWLARRRSADGDWTRLIDPDLLPDLRLAAAGGKGSAPPWPWLALAWTLALLALAGPAWERDATPAWRAPGAWVLVLDLSSSMAATDLAPNRATRARYAIDDLLAAARDARVGLVAFSDEAYTVTPLTEDVATVRAMLPALAPDIMPSPGDQLAPALEQAAKLLQQAGRQDGQVVVLSDGFADPAAAFAAARRLRNLGATLHVVGIGSAAGAPLADPRGGFALDAQGQPRLARLDTDRLGQLAASGGGRYVDLAGLPDLITALQAGSGRSGGATAMAGIAVAHWRDAGVWLLPALLLLVAFLGRRGWL